MLELEQYREAERFALAMDELLKDDPRWERDRYDLREDPRELRRHWFEPTSEHEGPETTVDRRDRFMNAAIDGLISWLRDEDAVDLRKVVVLAEFARAAESLTKGLTTDGVPRLPVVTEAIDGRDGEHASRMRSIIKSSKNADVKGVKNPARAAVATWVGVSLATAKQVHLKHERALKEPRG